MKKIDIYFKTKNKEHEIHLQETPTPSIDSVVVNGKYYALSGDSSQIHWLRDQIPELSSPSGISDKELQSRLSTLGATQVSIRTVEKSRIAGIYVLAGTSTAGKTSFVKALKERTLSGKCGNVV